MARPSFQTSSDHQLTEVLRTTSADREAAFQELYRRHARRVFVYCRRILDNYSDAEDVLQESFVDFLHYVRKHEEISHCSALLLRIARNRCLNMKRRSRDQLVYVDNLALSSIYTDSDSTHSEELQLLLANALLMLNDEQREALVLQMYNGLSYQEIAELTEVPLTTVRNRLVRAKDKLREILDPHRQHFR